MKAYIFSAILLILTINYAQSAEIVIEPSGTSDDAALIQGALDGLNNGDILLLNGNFILKHTIYLPSNFTWILDGSVTLAADADLDEAGWVDELIDATRRTGITEKPGGATNIDMSGGTYYGNSTNYPKSMRYLNFVSVTNSVFHDMLITEVTDDNFTLAPGCSNNECRNLIGSFSESGNAMTDKGSYNTWIDCVASNCGSDGWTPKCKYSTFIRCIAADNAGPGFGMYAREEGYANNEDVGAYIIGNKFIDCVSYGSLNSSGFSFNISSNCPGAVIKDNYIQAVCYDNKKDGVTFRNKDEAELGIIENNVVDIVCYGNMGLNTKGEINTWSGGLGMENDNSDTHNLIKNITGSVVSYDNRIDVNTRGGHNCNITVYHPDGVSEPVLDDKSSGNNTVTVIDYNCSDPLGKWCQYKYCGVETPPMPKAPSGLTADIASANQIDLSWTDNTDNEDGFSLEQLIDNNYIVIATLDANVASYSVMNLPENTEQNFRIQAFNISGFSGYSNEISGITVNTNTKEHMSSGSMMHKVFPNPFKETAHITYSLTKGSFVRMNIYNSSGREIGSLVHEFKTIGTHTSVFKGKDLPRGIYYYRIIAGDSFASGKIVLQK